MDMKAGVKTAAQLKTGAVSVSGYTGQKEKTLDVTFSKPEYYTVLPDHAGTEDLPFCGICGRITDMDSEEQI
ncbi:MAG: hypothetical protein ACLR23_24230 [Clostridia bacterium]